MSRIEIKDSQKMTRGDSKENVELNNGKPQEVINQGTEKEIWYYYSEAERIQKKDYFVFLHPLTWPWIIFHPFSFWDIQQRYELYFNGDILMDILSYRARDLP